MKPQEQLELGNPHIAVVSNGYVREGATAVHTQAMIGAHQQGYPVSVLNLNARLIRDGVQQDWDDPQTGQFYREYREAGVPQVALDREEINNRPAPLTDEHVGRVISHINSGDVAATLEEYPFRGGLLDAIHGRIKNPLVVNAYRNGLTKNPADVAELHRAVNLGIVTGMTTDAFASKEAYTRSGIPAEMITVIPNGIDQAKFAYSATAAAAYRELHNIPDDAQVVLNDSRWSPEKNVPLSIKTAAYVLAANPNIHFVLAGTGLGEDNPELTELIEKEFGGPDNPNRARLHLDPTPDFRGTTSAADAIVVTSGTESRPLIITQGQMNNGTPTITTNVGDAARMIDHGKYGIVVDGDPEKLTGQEFGDAVLKVLRNPDTYRFPADRRSELGMGAMVHGYRKVLRSAILKR